MKKYERKKTPISSPYSVYLKMRQDNSNNYLNNNNNDNYVKKIINDNNDNNPSYFNDIDLRQKNKINNMIINYKYFQNKKTPLNVKPLSNSLSMRTMNTENRKSEISNPDLTYFSLLIISNIYFLLDYFRLFEIKNNVFYKRNNADYNKYRAELKHYLDYNYQVLSNENRLNKKKEVNVNPFNPIDADFEHYKSDLAHNPILNPVNNYSFNKYLEKEMKNNKKTNTFQQAGNLLVNA